MKISTWYVGVNEPHFKNQGLNVGRLFEPPTNSISYEKQVIKNYNFRSIFIREFFIIDVINYLYEFRDGSLIQLLEFSHHYLPQFDGSSS